MDDPLRVATTATLSQIKSDIENSAFKGKFSVNALISKLAQNGVRVSQDQLRDLVKEEPWSNLIADIKGDTVVFKGGPDASGDAEAPDETSDTMDKMAKRAAKKTEM